MDDVNDFVKWELELRGGGPFDELGQCLCCGVDLCGSANCREHGQGFDARRARGEV